MKILAEKIKYKSQNFAIFDDLLILSVKDGPVKCAKVCNQSEPILTMSLHFWFLENKYMPS